MTEQKGETVSLTNAEKAEQFKQLVIKYSNKRFFKSYYRKKARAANQLYQLYWKLAETEYHKTDEYKKIRGY